ncbi:hypothetical protein TSMEX_009463 [Taenia solium]|eukprot:TsM_001218700 transcript=TsM_001218700 gene=TsM_001218700
MRAITIQSERARKQEKVRMTENIGFRVREPSVEYSNPELLKLASYLAQHDVAFNNLPQYPAESSEDQDAKSIKEVEPIIKLKSRREVSNRLPPRIHSPPVRDINLNYPHRKPLHAPTECQLNAAKASQLRQLINKSKAALLNLDSEISAGRAGVDLQMPSSGSRMSARYHLPRRAVAPSGVLKPCVRILNNKGTRKARRPALERWDTETVNAYRKAPHHSARSGTHDTNLLSLYLKRLALGSSFEGQVEDLQRSYLAQSCKSLRADSPRVDTVLDFRPQKDFQHQRKCPPELVAFLKKWGDSLKIRDPNESKGICTSPSRGRFYDSLSNSSSTSTDSIEKFIRNHSKQQVSYQNQLLKTTEVERNRHNSPKMYHSEYFSRAQSAPKVKTSLTEKHSITSAYQTLRLPVEQYRRLLTYSGTAEAVHEKRWRRDFPSNTTSLSHLCDWLAEEIVDSCVEAIANLIDCFSNDVIDEIFRHELVTSSSSPWGSFSGVAGSPQLRQASTLQPLLMSIPSEAPIELTQQEMTSGKCSSNQEPDEGKKPTSKHGSYSTTKPAGVSYTQPLGEDHVVTQEAHTSVLQPPVWQPQNALSPIEEVPTISFSPSKAKPNRSKARINGSERFFEGSFSASAVEDTLESTCMNASPHNYVTENKCVRKSSGDTVPSPNQYTYDEGVIEENATLHRSTGSSLQKNVENFSTLDVRVQTTESTVGPSQLVHADTIASTSSNAKISVPVECGTPSDTSARSSSIQTSLNSRKRLKLSGGLRMRSSSTSMDVDHKNSSGTEVMATITADEELFCNKHQKRSNVVPESEGSSEEFSLVPRSKCDRVSTSDGREMWVFPWGLNVPQTTQDDRSVTLSITSESLSSPKPVKLHQKPHSLGLVSSLTDTSVPDISTPDVATSTSSETLQTKTLPISDATVSVTKVCGNYEEDFEPTEESK